ncbi:MAG: YkgJ family cysteine cluster protein [Acidobacteria bacterium]|nr:YkgJ family cysteine cluster protein [Acidobacteriota bacterium]
MGFLFECRPDLDCYTRCCRDVSIVLTPYDVLRLKRALGMDSSEFLERHTISPFAAGQKIPVRLLKMGPQCPFVGPDGCAVYPHRPWACRMYPLGAPRDAFCQGHGQGQERQESEWLATQGVEEYEAMGQGFQQLMSDPFWDKAEALSPAQVDMFHMACYDLDRFRRFVFQSSFLSRFYVDEARVEAMRREDEELLDFGIQWLRFILFHERTMKIRQEV